MQKEGDKCMKKDNIHEEEDESRKKENNTGEGREYRGRR